MGLAICRSIADQLGGRLECRSAAGGTVFTLWLPQAATTERMTADG
jgi:signal transduction histidine kinase